MECQQLQVQPERKEDGNREAEFAGEIHRFVCSVFAGGIHRAGYGIPDVL